MYVETDASDLQRLGKNNLGGLRVAYGVRSVLATATRQPGRCGRKDVLAGNITVKSWRTQDDVPAVVTSENGLVSALQPCTQTRWQKYKFFPLCVEQPEKIPAGENIYQKGVINKYNPK